MGKNLYLSVSPLSPPPVAAAWMGRGWLGGAGERLGLKLGPRRGGGGPCVFLALGERAWHVDSWDGNPPASMLQSSHCFFDDATFE